MHLTLLALLRDVLIVLAAAFPAFIATSSDSPERQLIFSILILLLCIGSNFEDLISRLQLLQIRGELLVFYRLLLVVRQENTLGQEMNEHLLGVDVGLQVRTQLDVLVIDLLKFN